MAFRYRRMKQNDVHECVSFLLGHPSFGPQYEGDLQSIVKAWTTLQECDAFHANVLEEIIGDGVRLLGPGVWVVVTDKFAQEMKTPPFFWLGPELAKRVASGRSPLLSNDQLRKANATTGINVVAWPCGPSQMDSSRMEINHLFMGAFVEMVSGYRLKELFFQPPVAEQAMAVLQWGAALVSAEGTRTDMSPGQTDEVVKNPYVLVMNAELAASRFGSWASGLFVSRFPQIGFSRSEQRVLEEALRGGTDEELAMELEISISAVKKAWRSIYDRVERSKIGILPSGSNEIETTDRGKGKKHRLLVYVREHPEELRPISMKLLRQAQKKVNYGQANDKPAPTRRRVGRPRSQPRT